MRDHLTKWLESHEAFRKLIIAYSGGRDSHVLLHALWQIRQTSPLLHLKAVHVNHGLQKEAFDWQNHCQKICDEYAIPLTTLSLKLMPAKGESIEELAREKRYQAFANLIEQDETLLTAHMLEDQAETFLIQLMRGAGVRGLSSIAPLKAHGKGHIARPILVVSREKIAAYAQKYALKWVEDPSNLNLRFRRNYIRHQILPSAEQLAPGFAKCVARSAKHCAQSQAMLDEVFQADLKHCLGDKSHTLKISALNAFSPLKQQFILRYWFQQCDVLSPSTKKIDTILQQIFHAKIDANPCIHWGKHQVRRYQDLLYLLPFKKENEIKSASSLQEMQWDLASPLTLHDGSCWQAKRVPGQGYCLNRMTMPLTIRFRQGGERCLINGKKHTRPLKKILQEKDIPIWQRASLPLFYQGEKLVGVADLFICEGWQVQDPHEEGWLISKVI